MISVLNWLYNWVKSLGPEAFIGAKFSLGGAATFFIFGMMAEAAIHSNIFWVFKVAVVIFTIIGAVFFIGGTVGGIISAFEYNARQKRGGSRY